MSSDPTSPRPSIGQEPRLSRRQMLFGGAVGLSALALGRLGSGSVGAVAGQLNEPGTALATAFRVNPPTTTTIPTATTTTTTTTVPTTTELGAGEILFPIIVGPDDYCYVGRNFGAPRGGGSRSHEGVDIGADVGLPVIAVVDGALTKKYEDSGSCGGAGSGWTLTDEVNDVVYKFFHLDRHEEGLEVGDTVTAGQIIGYVGETGTSGVCSTTYNNYHLHFEYRPGDQPANPFDLLQRAPNVSFA
jgi:murein DD-endopeptidase MepM/ murein hydrolase activator NlpD